MNGIEPFHVYHPDPEEATFQSWHDYRYHEVSDVRNDKSIALLERGDETRRPFVGKLHV